MTDNTFTLSNVECIDTSKSSHPISTGIGFFDHMLDQLNSHAQVGVAITVKKTSVDNSSDTDHGSISAGSATDEHAFQVVNRYGNDDQGEIMGQVGAALGAELRKLDNYPKENRISRFCCPLDEALVECILTKPSNNDDEEEGKLINFTLPPYGIYPANIGRTKIGSMETKHVQTFFTNLASSSGLNISLIKVRGDNGHHIVESAFKAFSRALRNLLDGTSTNEYTSSEFENMWGNTSLSYTSGIELNREGRLERSTKETSILVHVLLNGGGGGGNTASKEGEGEGRGGNVKVHTGISTVDQFISILATEACMSLEVKCNGDLYVDDHHTSEDVSIALGQVLNVALGTKAGLNRMWCACGKYGGEFPYYFIPLLEVFFIHYTHDIYFILFCLPL